MLNIEESEDLEYKLYYSSVPFLVIGFIGNMLLIRIVHKTREMHTPTNFLLASMAASDIITILLWSFYFFEFAKFVCKFVVLIEISIKVSSVTLTGGPARVNSDKRHDPKSSDRA